jgi:hypothetical protein
MGIFRGISFVHYSMINIYHIGKGSVLATLVNAPPPPPLTDSIEDSVTTFAYYSLEIYSGYM